jgi:hypothetical protein
VHTVAGNLTCTAQNRGANSNALHDEVYGRIKLKCCEPELRSSKEERQSREKVRLLCFYICLYQKRQEPRLTHSGAYMNLFSRSSHSTIYPWLKCRGVSVMCFQRNPPLRKEGGETIRNICDSMIIQAWAERDSSPRLLNCFLKSRTIRSWY